MKLPSKHLLPALSALCLLATALNAADLVWVGGTGFWNAAANWSPAQIPGAADRAIITNNGTYTVVVPDSVNPTISSLILGGASGTQSLSLARSILTLNSASTVQPRSQFILTVGNGAVTLAPGCKVAEHAAGEEASRGNDRAGDGTQLRFTDGSCRRP